MIKSGIYIIKCIKNGNIYIGSSVQVYKRWTEHKYRLKKGLHTNKRLQHSWNAYGIENFEWSFVEAIENVDELLHQEQAWINKLNPAFNVIKDVRVNTKRHKPSKAYRKIYSDRMKGNKYAAGKHRSPSQEERDRISAKLKGTRHSDESYERTREKKIGHKMSEEIKLKFMLAQRARRSKEREGCKEIIHNPDYRRKMGEKVNTAKLNAEKVIEIRRQYHEDGISGVRLCEMYGVRNGTIYKIVNRQTWKHVA